MACVALLAGCAGDEDRPPLGGFGGEGGAGSGVAIGSCEGDEQRECGIKLDQGGGVVTCYRGVQFCENDMWSECVDGEVTVEADRTSLEYQGFFQRYDTDTLSTSPKAICSPADACDPYCYEVAEGSAVFTPGLTILETELCEVGDPTPNAECTAGPGCEHSLCTVGSGITQSLCGTCAATVCTAMSTCCGSSGSWTQACVDKAMELCVGAPPPLGLCDFGVFSESTLTFTDRPTLGGGSVGANGNVDFGTNSPSKFPNRLIVKGDLWIRSPNGTPVTATGGIWASGSVGIEAASTVWNTDIHAGEGVYLFGGNNVTGKVYTSTDYANSAPNAQPSAGTTYNISGQSGASITGTGYASSTAEIYTPTSSLVVSNKQVNPFPQLTAANIVIPAAVPALPSQCPAGVCPGGTNQSRTSSGDLSLNPGNYGTVDLQNGARLVLNGTGAAPYVYTMKSLTQQGSGGIKLGTATGQYIVIVEGKFQFGGSGSQIVNSSNAVLTDRTRLVVHVGSNLGGSCSSPNCAANIGDNAIFTGVLSVPNGTVAAGNTVAVRGALWAAAVKTNPDFTLTQMTKAECEGFNISGTGPPTFTCPTAVDSGAVTSTPGLTGTTVETCRTGLDCQMNQRCTNVDTRATGCSTSFNKCVATNAAVPSSCNNDPCVARVIAASAGCASNWSSTCTALIPAQCDAVCDTTSPYDRTGLCTSNSGFSGETGCSSTGNYDLALGYACTTGAIPICNHGQTQYSGNVTVGYWNINKRKFANIAPGLPDGTCTQNLPIAAGSCTNMTTCSSGSLPAAGTTYTFMVDPPTSLNANGVLSECGTAGNVGRRLDNWSWHDHTFACVNNPEYAEYEYLATCPDDSQARWKHLKWVTDNSTGTSVVFKAKVAKDVAGLAAKTFVTLATNTVDCSQANANALTSTCSVGLTSGLSLTSPQGQALAVRVEKIGTPVVTNWEITYTCVFDQ